MTRLNLKGRGALAVATAALLTATLAACSGAGAPSSTDDSLTLNVGQISNSVAFFPLFIAENEGYFTDEGLTLGANRPRMGTGAKLAAALQSGSIDVGAGVMTDAFNLSKVNDGTRIVGDLVNSYYVDVVVGSGFDGPDVTAPLSDRIEALRGKTIGVTGPGSGTEALIKYLLAQENIDPASDVTLVNLGADGSAAIGALTTERVDALVFFQPIGQQAETTGVGSIYISPARGDIPDLKGVSHGIVFTTQGVLDKKGPAVAAFLRGIQRAEELIVNDAAETERLLALYQDSLDPATLKALVPIIQSEVAATPQPNESGYKKSVDFHLQTGLFDDAPAFADIVPTDWIKSALKG